MARARGIQSIEIGCTLLAAMARHAAAMALRDIADASGLLPAQAHAYLTSLRRIGLVEQDAASGRYRLGWRALPLGMARMEIDPVLRQGRERMLQLVAATGAMGCLSVWADDALTVFDVAQGRHPARVNIHPGTIFSIAGTLSGKLFAAFAQADRVAAAIDREIAKAAGGDVAAQAHQRARLMEDYAQIRERGLAEAIAVGVPDLVTLALPHCDAEGHIACVITLIAPVGLPGWKESVSSISHLPPPVETPRAARSGDTPIAIAARLPFEDCLPNTRGVQTIEIGGRLLDGLAQAGEPIPLGKLAPLCGMTPAQAHAYLISYRRADLVEQDAATGHYRLGPMAIALAAARLRSFDPFRAANEILADLIGDAEYSATLSVWGNFGPTVVQLHQGHHQLYTSTAPGTVYSVGGTATGRVFAAFLPCDEVAVLAGLEGGAPVRRVGQTIPLAMLEAEFIAIRKRGYATIAPPPIPGVIPFAAPVLDHRGDIQMVVTIMRSAQASADAPEPIAALLKTTAAISLQFGREGE